jgi:hypothetical protein
MSESQSLSAREARVRRALAREGHALRKSRRDGTYMVVDPDNNTIVAYNFGSQDGYGLSLESIEAELPDS